MADLERRAFWHCLSAEDWATIVRSPSGSSYRVAFERMPAGHPVQFDYTCECRSFQFKKGTDSRGYCKHIRRVRGQHCGWMQFTHGGEPVMDEEGNRACPECGGPVSAMDWGV